jgi:hypothetical protein
MKIINIHKAQRTGKMMHESVTIIIDEEFPDGLLKNADTLNAHIKKMNLKYEIEAQKLFHALYYTLPGAVIDRLLIKLLEETKSHFIVPYGDLEKNDI